MKEFITLSLILLSISSCHAQSNDIKNQEKGEKRMETTNGIFDTLCFQMNKSAGTNMTLKTEAGLFGNSEE